MLIMKIAKSFINIFPKTRSVLNFSRNLDMRHFSKILSYFAFTTNITNKYF